MGGGEARMLVEGGLEAHGGDRTDAGYGHQTATDLVAAGERQQLAICSADLCVERIEHRQQRLDVRGHINMSRAPQIDLRSRASCDGICTDGRSMRHEARLNASASRRSFLVWRAPTPSAGANVAGTTRTS